MNDQVGGVTFVFLEPTHGVLKNRQVSGMVLRQFSRTHKRGFSSPFSRLGGDFFIIGRDNNPCNALRLRARSDAVADEGVTREQVYVFARDAF